MANLCGLQSAESNRAILRYIMEDPSCWGATPTTGRTRELRIVSSSLTATKETVVSEELRADRMVADVVEVAASSGGDVEAEFSAGTYDDFMQAFLMSFWSKPMTYDKFTGNVSIEEDFRNTRVGSIEFDAAALDASTITVDDGINPPVVITFETTTPNAALNEIDPGASATSSAQALEAHLNLLVSQGVLELASVDETSDTVTITLVATSGGSLSSTGEDDDFIVTDFDDVPVAATVVTVTGRDVTPYFQIGRVVKTEGFRLAANNDYWTIAEMNFAAGNTTIHMFETGAVTEAANAFAKVFDANDVLIRADDISFGASPAGLTSASSGFADLITGGQLQVGQKIYVSGYGYESGTFVFGSNPADGTAVVIHDGVRQVRFEFDNNSAFQRGSVQVAIGGTANDTAANLAAAINDQLGRGSILAGASVSTNTVTVRNFELTQLTAEVAALTALSSTSPAVVATSFSGGIATFGFFTITSLADDFIGVAETVATDANSGNALITIKGSHVRNPGNPDDIVPQSLSIETRFTDVDISFLMNGLRVGGFTKNIASGELISETWTLLGKETFVQQGGTYLGDAPYTPLDSTATPVLSATVNVGQLTRDGEVLEAALQSIELTGEAALREQRAVSYRFAAGIGTGRFNLTATITSYFETIDNYLTFLNQDRFSLGWDVRDNDKNVYFYTIPALKATSNPVAPEGIDSDVLETIETVAIRDPNLNCMLMVDRFSSYIPPTA